MSIGIQNFTPRCKKCMDAQWFLRREEKSYWNLEILGMTKSGFGIKMKCLGCGHVSVRYSKAARRSAECKIRNDNKAINQTSKDAGEVDC